MSDTVVIGIFTVGAALLGGIVGGIFARQASREGFEASERASRQRAAEEQQTLVYNVTTLLHQEIEHNRDLLKALWDKVMLNPPPSDDNYQREFQMRTRFVAAQIPQWGQLMWESQAGHLPTALASGVIRQVYDFYTQLDSLAELQSRIDDKLPSNLVSEVEHWRTTAPLGIIPPSLPEQQTWHKVFIQLINETQEPWDRASGTIKGILSNPNPVPEATNPPPAPRLLGGQAHRIP